jgi:hypothetical protein
MAYSGRTHIEQGKRNVPKNTETDNQPYETRRPSMLERPTVHNPRKILRSPEPPQVWQRLVFGILKHVRKCRA